MRKKIVAGNWKMNLDRLEGINLVNNILSKLPLDNSTEVVFAPSFVHLYKIAKITSETTNVYVGAQNCSFRKDGALTGEVSVSMIASCNAKYVIIGHSERRENFHETNNELKIKVNMSLANSLEVIFCCGESLEQRESGLYFDWIESQLSQSLFHLTADEISKIVIAYEPIWAIGTGVTASSEQAQEMHEFIRNNIARNYDHKVANNISILYGGSCNAHNARQLFSQHDIDGGLIGGASLDADNFLAITQSF